MLKMTATGFLTSDVSLRTSKETGQPYAIMRIASKRPYRNRDGSRSTDYISVRVRGHLAENCARMGYKGCKVIAWGEFEIFAPDYDRQPGFILKAFEVEFVSPKKDANGEETIVPRGEPSAEGLDVPKNY